MKAAGIIWDLDGTLCDTLPLCIAAFREVYERRLKRSFSDEEIVAGFGASEAGVLRASFPDDWQTAEEEYLAGYLRLHDRLARVFPGVSEVLHEFGRRGVRQAVVTGKGPRSTAITLERLQLAPHFEFVETGQPEGPVKPAGIRAVLAAWQILPGQVAYVGDTPYDTAAALEAGVRPVRAAWTRVSGGMAGSKPHVTAHAAYRCAHPAEVLAWYDRTEQQSPS